METMLAAVRAADQVTLYSLYFPDHGCVKAAAVAGCVCLDGLTCTECERILGVSFAAIERAARKKQRTGRPVPVAQGLGLGAHGVQGSGAAISGMAERLGRGSHPPSDGVEGFDAAISDTAGRQVVSLHPPSEGVERSGAAISSTADRLVVSLHPPSEGVERSGAAISGTADRLVVGSQPDGVEGSDAVISGTADWLVVGSHPPSDGIEGSEAAISGTADRLVTGSHPPSDGIGGFEATISGMAAPPVPCSHPPSDGIEGFEVTISGMTAPPVPGSHSPSDGIEGSDAAISGTAAPPVPGSHSPSDGIEGSDAAISETADQLVPRSHPPSDGIEGSKAEISGTADRLVPGSHPPSDGIEESEMAISSMADRLGPCSNGAVEGFEADISGMAARLGLAAAVGERAKDVFRKMEEASAWPPGPGRWRVRSRFQSERPLVYAACLSIACRAEGSALTLRELAMAASADGGVTKKDIARLAEHIKGRLGKEEAGQSTGVSMVCVSSYVRRFGVLVGLREADAAVALEAARRLEEGVFDVRHNVDSVAAAVVCIVLERAGAKRPSVKDVAAATGVSHATINTVSRKLRAHDGLLFG